MGPNTGGKLKEVVQNPCQSDRLLLKQLEAEPTQSQKQITDLKFQELLQEASKPRYASGDACTKLCYFIEQCKSSSSPYIQEVIFSKEACLALFNLYIEWSEKAQSRSLRQVLELVSSIISRNPKEQISEDIKASILRRTLSILSHQATQVLVKPSFRVLESLLSKNTISLEELLAADEASNSENVGTTQSLSEPSWDSFISRIFYWLGPADVSPAAGKFLVALFKRLKATSPSSQHTTFNHTGLWRHWIQRGLAKDPQILENVKNYLLPPLFKIDRPGSLEFLRDLNQKRPISDVQDQEIDSHALLQLVSMEVGKKLGLVEEPNLIRPQKEKLGSTITLDEYAVGSLLSNFSDTVRSLAFSVLISSSSPMRPLSPFVLDSLQTHIALLFSDVDAKFRGEILSSSKHLIERLRGSTAFLARELDQSHFALNEKSIKKPNTAEMQAVHDAAGKLLLKHQEFIQWHLEFCLAELIPTASYQRHITALKTITLFLHSRIDSSVLPNIQANSTAWPFNLQFFTPRSMRLLLDLLVDPFEDVRSSAAEILKLALPINFAAESSHSSLEDVMASRSQPAKVNNEDPSLQNEWESTRQNATMNIRSLGLLMAFIERASEASRRTGRADYADGVARSYKILYGLQTSTEARMKLLEELVDDLESKVVIAEQDLAQAVQEAPIHGSFATLNLICDLVSPSLENNLTAKDVLLFWSRWGKLQLRMIALSARIWAAVKDILCSDAPEGYLPQDLDDHDAIDAKGVLSYSFRATHESSNLMRSIAATLKRRWPDELGTTTHTVFARIGDLTFEQLSTLRHRGAFSTVSLTFSYCCQLSQHTVLFERGSSSTYHSGEEPLVTGQIPGNKLIPIVQSNSVQNTRLIDDLSLVKEPSLGDHLLRHWWMGTVACIHRQESTTRRSAGIPALVTGIMSANSHQLPVGEIMGTLMEEARMPVDSSLSSSTDLGQLPQVHALNSLKEIFKSSSIKEVVDDQVADCIQIAAEALTSSIWPIRNCGLLLFQSLSNFLISGENTAPTSVGWNVRATRIHFSRYPNLVGHLMRFLEMSPVHDEQLMTNINESLELIFPALDLIRIAGPPEEYFESIYNNVLRYLGSNVWQVRELAASTICRLTTAYSWSSKIPELIKRSGESANKRHGALLAVKVLLERQLQFGQYSTHDIPSIVTLFQQDFAHNVLRDFPYIRAPMVLAAQIEDGNLLLRIIIASRRVWSSGEAARSWVKPLLNPDGYNAMQQLLDAYTVISGVPSKVVFNQFACRGVYLAAIQDDLAALGRILQYSLQLGDSVALAALDAINDAWKYHQTQEQLLGLTKAYITVICSTASSSVRSAALLSMETTLSGIQDFKTEDIYRSVVVLCTRVLSTGPKGPELEIAHCRISGFLTSSILLSNQSSAEKKEAVRTWGTCMHDFSADNMDLPRRLAAATALDSFYRRPEFKDLVGDDCLLPSLWALFRILNDDDDDIRRLGASAASAITDKLSAPWAARDELVDVMERTYCNSAIFGQNIVQRMVGRHHRRAQEEPGISPSSARLDMFSVLDEDDSLFVEEKANLWLDEVSEVKRWSKVFPRLPKNIVEFRNEGNAQSPLDILALYTLESLDALVNIMDHRTPTAGWDSRPATFYACARALRCGNAALAYLANQCPQEEALSERIARHPLFPQLNEIVARLEAFILRGLQHKIHWELVASIVSPNSLASNRLDTVLPAIPEAIKHALPPLSIRLQRR